MISAEQFAIFVGVLVTTSLFLKWRKKKEISPYNNPPSLPSLPLVGSVGLLSIKDLPDAAEFFMTKAKELGPIFTFRFGNRLMVTLNSKEAIEKAYIKKASAFSDRPEIFVETLANPDNKGIIFVRSATDWKKPQQLSLCILKEFGFGFKNIMELRINKEIEAMTEYVTDKSGELFDPKEMSTLVTSNIINNILFGYRRDYEHGLSDLSIQIDRWVSNVSFICDIVPIIRFLPSYRKHLKTFVENSKSLFGNIEAEIDQSLQNTTEPCFVQSYILKAGPDYDRAQLNYMLRDFVAAGTETVATTLQWALVAMANNPAVQKRLHDEIDAVLTGDRLPTLQDEAKLPYVEATILEINRWRTLTPLSSLRSTSQDSIVDGYFIPTGTMVIANLYAAHNDPSIWKDPEVFRPERFLDVENKLIDKEKVIPFSIGRRSCLGEVLARAELFLIFTSLVKGFLVLPQDGQEKVNDDPIVSYASTLYPSPFKIRLIKRQ